MTLAFQSQLYARWLQFAGAAVAGCAVAVYGLSKNSLDPSGAICMCQQMLSCMLPSCRTPQVLPIKSQTLRNPQGHMANSSNNGDINYSMCCAHVPACVSTLTSYFKLQSGYPLPDALAQHLLHASDLAYFDVMHLRSAPQICFFITFTHPAMSRKSMMWHYHCVLWLDAHQDHWQPAISAVITRLL